MSVVCESCGSIIIGDESQIYCSNCVLQTGLQLLAENRPVIDEWDSRLERFDIIDVLGTNMALVFRVHDKEADRVCVLKLLVSADAPGFHERFEREAEALKTLKHPNIVELIEAGEIDGVPFILMEDGGENLKRAVCGTTRSVVEIMVQVCDAISHAHESGFIHRDIKPENILVAADGAVRVTDFGIAKLTSDERQGLTETGDLLGTAYYMAPEQLTKGEAVNHRVDIYGLGAVLFELVTGVPPIDIHGQRQLNSLDRRLRHAIRKAVDPNPDARWQSVGDLQERLKRWLTTDRVRQKLVSTIPKRRTVMKCFTLSGVLAAALFAFNSEDGKDAKPGTTTFDNVVVRGKLVVDGGTVEVVDKKGRNRFKIDVTDVATTVTLTDPSSGVTAELFVGGDETSEETAAVLKLNNGETQIDMLAMEPLAGYGIGRDGLFVRTSVNKEGAVLTIGDKKADGERVGLATFREDGKPASSIVSLTDRYGDVKFKQVAK